MVDSIGNFKKCMQKSQNVYCSNNQCIFDRQRCVSHDGCVFHTTKK